jgi:hypothetical protein
LPLGARSDRSPIGQLALLADRPSAGAPGASILCRPYRGSSERNGRAEDKERDMRKWIAAVAIVTAGVSIGGTAFAGEVTGSGKGGPNGDGTTPISEFRAGSICAFSGLNDDPNEPGLFNDGQVQNWGDVVVEAKVVFGDGHGASAITDVMHEEGPGTSCRGFASQG